MNLVMLLLYIVILLLLLLSSLFMQHIICVCPSRKRDPSSDGLSEVSPILLFLIEFVLVQFRGQG